MIYLLLGIIIGLILATLWFAIICILPQAARDFPKTIQENLKKRNRPKGAIIDLPSDAELARDEQLKRNQALGVDTPLDTL
jgi:hypothetical protein